MYKRILATLLIVFFVCAAAAGSEEQAASEQQGIFNGTLADAIWSVLTFVLLLVILSKLAWKPLLKNLQGREDYIKNQLTGAENARLKAEKLLDEYKKQCLEMMEKTTRHAHQAEKEIIERAGKDTMAMKQRAILEINHAQDMASQQLWQQAGDMLLAISHEILGRSITADDNNRLINEAIARIQHEQSSGMQK